MSARDGAHGVDEERQCEAARPAGSALVEACDRPVDAVACEVELQRHARHEVDEDEGAEQLCEQATGELHQLLAVRLVLLLAGAHASRLRPLRLPVDGEGLRLRLMDCSGHLHDVLTRAGGYGYAVVEGGSDVSCALLRLLLGFAVLEGHLGLDGRDEVHQPWRVVRRQGNGRRVVGGHHRGGGSGRQATR
jgi:hypothetical protein